MASQKSKKFILTLVLLIALLLVSIYYVISKQKIREGTNIQQTSEAEQRKQRLENDTDTTLDVAENQSPATKEDAVTAQRPDLFVEIKSVTQKSKLVDFNILLTNKPNKGTCTIKLERYGFTTIEETIDLSQRTCQKETLELGPDKQGTWTATVMIKAGSVVSSDTKNITII